MAPKAIGSDDKIPCTTPDQLVLELEKLEDALAPEETEDTWGKIEKALLRFAAVTRGGGYRHTDVYMQGVGIKGLGDKIVRCMLSDRGKLSGVATDFLTSMAPRLASSFIPLIPLYVPPLIKLLARPNKVYLRRAEKSLHTIAQYCAHPSFILLVKQGVDDKSDTCRRACGGVLAFVLQTWEVGMMGNKGMLEVEDAMRRMATERDAEVRKIAKGMWEVYNELYADRVGSFTTPLTPTTRRYLNIKPSAGGPPKMHPLATSTTGSVPRYPSALGSSSTAASRSVSSSSTSAQIGAGGQRAVSAGSASKSSGMRMMGTSAGQGAGGFPFPTLPSSSSSSTAAMDFNNGRSALSRSTSAAVITQQQNQSHTQPSLAQPGLHSRAVSSADIQAGSRSSKISTNSGTHSTSIQSMIDPIPHTRQASAGPSRPRVISNVSSTDTLLNASSSGTSGATTTTAQARRANLAAIGQGPVRPVRTYIALANVTEGKESAGSSLTPRGNLFGAPVRPNLQARVTSAGFTASSTTTTAAATGQKVGLMGKRNVSAGIIGTTARKPILPPGVQARVDAKQAEGKREDDDVFSAPALIKPEDMEPREKKTADTGRQTFRPTSSTSREGSEVKKIDRQASETRETKQAQVNPVARAPISSQAATAARTVQSSPQAKLVVSPRQPRIKMKPPLPSSTVPKKKVVPARAAIGETAAAGRARSHLPSQGEQKERTPFRPMSRGMVSSTSKVKIIVPDARSSATSSPTPKARVIVPTSEVQRVASDIPLPPSPTLAVVDQDVSRIASPTKIASQITARFPPDSPIAQLAPAASPEPALLAQETPLPESDDEGHLHPNSPTMTPNKFGQIESRRLAELVINLGSSSEDPAAPLLNEAFPIPAGSPAPSSSAETIPIEWESDVPTEDEGAEGDVETEGETSVASVTFKKPEDRNAAQRDTLARAVARRLVAQKAEMEKEGDLLKFSSESEPEKEADLLDLSEPSEAEDEAGTQTKTSISRILADKGINLQFKALDLPATPDKATPLQKRPRVRQLQEFFENLSPPEQHEAQSPDHSSPLGHTSGRPKVRMMGHGGTTPSSSPPPRLAA